MLVAIGLLLAAIMPEPALANRTYSGSTITGFNGPTSVAFDANEDVWISDGGHAVSGQTNSGNNGIYEYGPYPSQTLLEAPDTEQALGGAIFDLDLAVDDTSDQVFVAQANGRTVKIFDNEIEHEAFSHEWSGINGQPLNFSGIHVAIDNSDTASEGRVYLSLTSPEDDVEAFDASQRPVDFPATASYIQANKLTGTPSGPFGSVENITVDNRGNIYVTDAGNGVVDQFDSTGTFVRTFPGSGGVAVDPINGNVLISNGSGVAEFDSSGNHLETITQGSKGGIQTEGTPAVNSRGYLYVPIAFDRVDIFTPATVVPKATYKSVSHPTTNSGTLNAEVDPDGGGNITECEFEYGEEDGNYNLGNIPCKAISSLPYSAPTEVSADISGLSTESTYHYRVVVSNASEGGIKYGADQAYTPHKVIGLSTEEPSNLTETGATLNGSFIGNGEDTHYYFEWGLTTAYGNKTSEPPADAGSPTSKESLSFSLTGLTPYTTYHYRIVATNRSGTSAGEDQMFTTPPGVPSILSQSISEVHSDRAVMSAQIDPNGAVTTFHFEYVDGEDFEKSGWADASSTPGPEVEIGMSKEDQTVSLLVNGLRDGTVYHYRAVAKSEAGTGTPSREYVFTTFATSSSLSDPCPNAHVRQQTGTALLLDCRAYELVSAPDSGGYDVESTLVPEQSPFADYPEAENPSQVLYGIHDGGIPGTGNTTNRGVDPYVATRGETGWSTKYVGIPANNPFVTAPFSSTLLEANASLETLAFGGPEICSPCFGPGQTETGEPIHLPNGELVQGMVGSMPQPAAKAEGFIGKDLSANGEHFVFGSKSKFEPEGNSNGDISIYDRNLKTDETYVVSKTPAETTMSGVGIGELDISSDGSHILFGQLTEESEGSKFWHLYMNVGDSKKSIELTPGAGKGVLFDGMTADGSKVFFSSEEHLTGEDTEHSGADIYVWSEQGEEEGNPLALVSTGADGAGNAKSCDPSANTKHAHWNTTGGEENCGDVAVGGGGGVASESGAIYFLSPERLDGPSNGVQEAPNLYLSDPGKPPQFVATLESSSNATLPNFQHSFLRSFGSFERPAGVAVTEAGTEKGDVYVLDITRGAGGFVQKFNSTGHPVTNFADKSILTEIPEQYGEHGLSTEIAVDNDPSSPSYRDFYIPSYISESNAHFVAKFSPSGHYLSQFEVPQPSGVAVDQANGDVYVTSEAGEVSIHNSQGDAIGGFPTIPHATGVAVDPTSGIVYVVNGGGYNSAEGEAVAYKSNGEFLRQVDAKPSVGIAVDPESGHVYVDEGTEVSEFDSSGKPFGGPIGKGLLSGSISLAVNEGYLYISNSKEGNVASYGPAAVPTDPEVDNPLVVDSVSSPGTRHPADFQISPSGDDAVFPSTLPLTGYDNAAHSEIFRYDTPTEKLECASCNPTSEQASGEASLPTNGLGLSEDGRVFFNSTEGLVDRDLNEEEDAYEWQPRGFEFGHGTRPCETAGGCIDLISPGTSPFASSLLGISANAIDAYFFTRDKLVEQDRNGNTVKIYDARELGGFPFAPPPVQCKASDECHGASSPAPPAPDIQSIGGSPGGNELIKPLCKAGFLEKHGRCVRKPHKPKRHHKRKQRRRSHRHD